MDGVRSFFIEFKLFQLVVDGNVNKLANANANANVGFMNF